MTSQSGSVDDLPVELTLFEAQAPTPSPALRKSGRPTPGTGTESWWPRVRRAVRAATRPERVLAAVATVLFPVAVLAPFFTVHPSFGDPLIDALVEAASPGALDPQTHSVVEGITLLFAKGNRLVAVLLVLFSVLFPAVKLALLWETLAATAPAHPRRLRVIEGLGPWSMADVFVASVCLVCFLPFPGGTTFTLEVGYYLYLTSVVAGLASAWLVNRRQNRPSVSTPKEV